MELDVNLSFGIFNTNNCSAIKTDKTKRTFYLEGKKKLEEIKKNFRSDKEFSANKLKEQELTIEINHNKSFNVLVLKRLVCVRLFYRAN